jgi:hypothetical protein
MASKWHAIYKVQTSGHRYFPVSEAERKYGSLCANQGMDIPQIGGYCNRRERADSHAKTYPCSPYLLASH